jgi:hypothetical protein
MSAAQATAEADQVAASRGLTQAQRQQASQEGGTPVGHAYRKVANQPATTLHQVTTWLAKTKSVIVVEDLYVPHSARPLADFCGICVRQAIGFS